MTMQMSEREDDTERRKECKSNIWTILCCCIRIRYTHTSAYICGMCTICFFGSLIGHNNEHDRG